MARGGGAGGGRRLARAALVGAALVAGWQTRVPGAAGVQLEGDDDDLFGEAPLPDFNASRVPEITDVYAPGDCELGQAKEGDQVQFDVLITWAGGVIMDTFRHQGQKVDMVVGDETVLKGVNWITQK